MTYLIVIEIPAGMQLDAGDEVCLSCDDGAIAHGRVLRANAIDAELSLDRAIADPSAWHIDYVIAADGEEWTPTIEHAPPSALAQFNLFGTTP